MAITSEGGGCAPSLETVMKYVITVAGIKVADIRGSGACSIGSGAVVGTTVSIGTGAAVGTTVSMRHRAVRMMRVAVSWAMSVGRVAVGMAEVVREVAAAGIARTRAVVGV